MVKRVIDDLIERLETRQMSVSGLRCIWCSSCLRVGVTDPAVKKSFELLWPGEENCRQPIESGPITECIADLRHEASELRGG